MQSLLSLPRGCGATIVTHDRFAPELRRDDHAIVDLAARVPINRGLFWLHTKAGHTIARLHWLRWNRGHVWSMVETDSNRAGPLVVFGEAELERLIIGRIVAVLETPSMVEAAE